MQQQTDATGPSYYHHPYYHNPAADAGDDPSPVITLSSATPYASAPPLSYSPSNYSGSQPTSFAPINDHAPNPNLQYSFPHSYPHNQAPLSYDFANPTNTDPNTQLSYYSQFSNSYSYGASPFPHHANSFNGYGGDEETFDGGVYKYNGGAKGGLSSDSGSGAEVMFDDYGRPINVHGGTKQNGFGTSSSTKIVKAVPKVEDSGDVKSGVQKFRVRLLSEGYGQTDMDVLCQIGLDGIRILDPETSRTLKIYSLEMVTRWEVLDSHIYAFWAKTSVDPEPKRIRLKSNSYTTNNILDMVTAASIQSKEIGAGNDPSDLVKGAEQSMEKKRGFIDWKNLIKPIDEEKDHWVPDEAKTKCTACRTDFSAFNRKHHCRNCGDIFCDKCTQGRIALTADEHAQQVRVCDQCMAEITQRLSNNEAPSRISGLHSHEDLARKLQEEMDKKCKTGLKSETSNTKMREVECPTCTVHLQVVVPASGSETIECSVCQHPFLVNAN